jgi:2',3'-cyclic-nucleotide 2'-phosphodiesterase (5'-nucleotidase family)
LPAKIEEGKPISEHARLRVVATHDFCCAYPPSPTSYGSLPGGEGLKKTVDALKEQGPTVRADAGDFAAPGALATLSDGMAGFAAAADLGIDVGVVGNHEFEWGVEPLRTRRRRASRSCAPTPPRSDCPRRRWSRRTLA